MHVCLIRREEREEGGPEGGGGRREEGGGEMREEEKGGRTRLGFLLPSPVLCRNTRTRWIAHESLYLFIKTATPAKKFLYVLLSNPP